MAGQDNVYNCDDESLGKMLYRLFVTEGNDEVVVTHPTEGDVVVTKDDYKKHLANLSRVNNMSPADRVTENARLKNLKNQKQIRFRTAMIDAPVHTVDMEGENNFGVDVDGVKLDIDGMAFVGVAQYPKGIAIIKQEIGCFVDEHDEKRKPIRIKQKE